MHMNALPEGQSKSLDELLADQGQTDTVDAPIAAGLVNQPLRAPMEALVDASKVVRKIELHLIVDSPYQPRDRYDESSIQALGDTLHDRGQDEPVIVRRLASGKYELISGHRRSRAARLIGWSEIEALVIDCDDRTAELKTLTANESNVELGDYERAKAYRRALERGFAKDQMGVAKVFGCSQGQVSKCLSLLDLPAPFLAFMAKFPALIGYRHAHLIKNLLTEYPGEEERIAIGVEILIDQPKMSVEQLRLALVKPFAKRRVRPKAVQPRIIADKNGTSAFQVQVKAQEIVIKVEPGVDVELASRRAMGVLREMASTLELSTEKNLLKSKG